MEFMKTIKEFHWITKMVIALTGLLLGLLLIALVLSLYWMSSNNMTAFNASQGIGMMVLALSGILPQVFLLVLVIIAVYTAVTRVKTWIEKYLDAMLARLDTLTNQKAEREADGASLVAMNEKFMRVEKKLDNIERILEKVSD